MDEKIKLTDRGNVRVLGVVLIFVGTFISAYLYFRHLYFGKGIISINQASENLLVILEQTFISNLFELGLIVLALIVLKKRFAEMLNLKLDGKRARITVAIVAILYIASLIRQLIIYDDTVTVIARWIYYLVAIALMEEFIFRGIMPAMLQNRVSEKLVWILPSVLFALGHMLMPMVQGLAIAELIETFINSFLGYVVGGLLFEVCKRWSKTLWLGVLIHAFMDFGL